MPMYEYQENRYQKKWRQTRPQKDYRHIYSQLAQALCSKGMYIEESSGSAINYGDKQVIYVGNC